MKFATTKGEKVKIRDWSKAEGFDRAYLSHHHSIEVVDSLSYDYGFFQRTALKSVGGAEYRNVFIMLTTQHEFCVTTIVYVDSSTYTFLHPITKGSVTDLPPNMVHRLSNADIRRAEDRARRRNEIILALIAMGFIPEAAAEKPEVSLVGGGPVSKREADGTYVLDYTSVSGKIDQAEERVIDYSKFSRYSNVESPKDDSDPKKGDIG